MADILIYGGELPGVCAAAKAATFAPGADIVLVVPEAPGDGRDRLGGIATSGGQNFWDVRLDRSYSPPSLYTQGTFNWLYSFGVGYNTDDLAAALLASLEKYGNITVYFRYDIERVTGTGDPVEISGVRLRRISRDGAGAVTWAAGTRTVSAGLFIDASTDGRLTRLANAAGVTTGRFDWPAKYSGSSLEWGRATARQQAATLMLRVTGIDPAASGGDFSYSREPNGSWSGYGGTAAYKQNPAITAFNGRYGPEAGFALKPVNCAQNGADSGEWWVNSFLIFDVDGRLHDRDLGAENAPAWVISGQRSTDAAWTGARTFLRENAGEVLGALRQFPGFSGVEFVWEDGRPATGEVLYIRETVHSVQAAGSVATGTENRNYALTADMAAYAGAGPTDGADQMNYASRIGVGWYGTDIHPYKFTDLTAEGRFLWGAESMARMRPDMPITGSSPENPLYIPYGALLNGGVRNLLTPGYAASIAAYAWGEMRVLPNLCVLGDAAGVAAAHCLERGISPHEAAGDVAEIRQKLLAVGARLEK